MEGRLAVMFHVGRSGSRVLGDLLNQHEDIDWRGEIAHPPRYRDFLGQFGVPASRGIFGLLDAISGDRRAPWLGIEMKFYHLRRLGLDLGEFIGELRQRTDPCRFVVLRRANTLRKIVSSLIAKEAGRYHRSARESLERHRVRVDPDLVPIDTERRTLLGFLEQFERDFAALDELLADDDPLDLTFEKDVAPDPRVACRRVCAHLGVVPGEAEVALGRTNPFPLRELIENFDEVEAHLAGTRFAWMTREGGRI